MRKNKQQKIVAVSGGFDPIHIGHIRMFQEAKKLGDKLIVILNNDNWFKVKGKPVFMSHKERKEIIEALECVDEVIISGHRKNTKDISVCRELLKIKPHIFANAEIENPRIMIYLPLNIRFAKNLALKWFLTLGKGVK